MISNTFRRRFAMFAPCAVAVCFAVVGSTTRSHAQAPRAASSLRSLGGTGGQAFTEQPGQGARLIGMKVWGSHGDERKLIVAFQPIFRAGDAIVPGTPYGKGIDLDHAEAQPGYAVGAIIGQAGDHISGLRLIFMRDKHGRLDPTDSYPSRWLGKRTTLAEVRIDGGGRPLIGVTAHL